jgi:hypothetical protein
MHASSAVVLIGNDASSIQQLGLVFSVEQAGVLFANMSPDILFGVIAISVPHCRLCVNMYQTVEFFKEYPN